MVKIGRQNSIHVTPTVLLDGIHLLLVVSSLSAIFLIISYAGLVDPAVSSSFGKDEWQKYVSEKLA